VIGRVLLSLSRSDRIRDLATSAPVARDVVRRYVAGETADDAVRAAGELAADGRLVTLDHLGEDTTEPAQAAATRDAPPPPRPPRPPRPGTPTCTCCGCSATPASPTGPR
jgi:hypothetical protein